MVFQITVQPGPHVFQADEDETILDAALRQGLSMPHSCRDGACGTCRGKVLGGTVDHGKAQLSALDARAREAGFALLCCARAKSDLLVEIKDMRSPQEMPVKTLPTRVEKMTLAAPDVMIVELRLPTGVRLPFLAGQYIDILTKGGRRAFSIANAPLDDALLQLHIRRIPGGQFTTHVFTGMKERDMLRINGPHGSFFLRETSDKPIILVAGGTGFAPIKAIVEQTIAEGCQRPVFLYWGGRRREDLYLRDLAEQWAKEHPHIHFIPVLSEPAPDDQWTGKTGFVHTAAMADHPDLAGFQAYVCGSPAMIAAVRRDFVGQCRLPEDEFFADAFESARHTNTD